MKWKTEPNITPLPFSKKLMPENLFFDDAPIDHLLHPGAAKAPTPANLIDLWQTGDKDQVPIDAVTAVLSNRPNLVKHLKNTQKIEDYLWETLENAIFNDRCRQSANFLIILSSIYRTKKQISFAVRLQRQAADTWKTIEGPDHSDTLKATRALIEILEEAGEHEEAALIQLGSEMNRLVEKGDPDSLLRLRHTAYEFFEKGQYHKAKAIYKGLLQKKFEVPGTLSHLARALLAMPEQDNREKAYESLMLAWEKRCFAPAYVPPRILFWIVLLKMLGGKTCATLIGMIKFAIQENSASMFMDYTILPVLDRWKGELSSDEYSLLRAIGAALSNRSNIAALEKSPLWQDQTPVDPDSFEIDLKSESTNDQSTYFQTNTKEGTS